MELDKFQAARLIPITGMKGEQDQERRATSALLSVMSAVPEFSRSLLKPLGAPVGKLRAFIEPEFELDSKAMRPDGLIVIERAGKKWTALVEVKTGKNPLVDSQLNSYLDIARMHKFDYLISISNEIVTLTGQHPTEGVDARKLRTVKLEHFSWSRIIKEAIIQYEHVGIADPDQAWILSELLRFLQHDASGANDFEDMGPDWVGVRESVSSGTISASDKRLPSVVRLFESLISFITFRLSARLGVQVSEVSSKTARTDPKKHYVQTVASFVANRSLSGVVRIPDTAGDLRIIADLRGSQVSCSFDIAAPLDGRNPTRIAWLLRQLPKEKLNVRVDTWTKGSRSSSASSTLVEAQQNPKALVPPDGREIVFFTIVAYEKMGSKRGSGAGSFIKSVVDVVDSTYEQLLQPLRRWQAKAPKLSQTVIELMPDELSDS